MEPMTNMRMSALWFIMLMLATGGSALARETWTFVFGSENSRKHAVAIQAPVRFSNERGHGFDFATADRVRISTAQSGDSGHCSAEHPFYFSVKVPEGHYMVKAVMGHPEMPSVSTIKAEARRLMVCNDTLKAGETATHCFVVNVRSPVIEGTDSISLKPREYNYMNWDNRLTLEFSGRNQALRYLEIEPIREITTLFLAGNSTVTDQDREPWASWGQLITCYFDTGVAVANFAESGASLASFKGRKRLDKVMSLMKPGDYLFIEFGHNDQKRSGHGIGPWDSYTALLEEFIGRTRAKGAMPVLVTPTQRRSFDEQGRITGTHGDYPAAMRKVARKWKVPLIDLNEMTRTIYESWGPEGSRKAFVHYPAGTFPGQEEALKDNTHFNAFGAREIALCVLQGIMDNEIGLAGHVVDFGGDYDPARPTRPSEWSIPRSPRYVSSKPEGN